MHPRTQNGVPEVPMDELPFDRATLHERVQELSDRALRWRSCNIANHRPWRTEAHCVVGRARRFQGALGTGLSSHLRIEAGGRASGSEPPGSGLV
jgi:hypothetical protein